MTTKPEFLEIVRDITQDKKKSYNMTSRDLLRYFWCEKRTSGNTARINEFLHSKNLVTEPDYQTNWIDGEIVLKHKDMAKTKLEKSPILPISILPSANKQPLTINRDAKVSHAITQMMMNNYSQLPVMSNPRTVEGILSWETLAMSITNGNKSEDVKDYLKKDVTVLDKETPLFEAIKIVLEKGIVLVQEKDKTLSGIITIADISKQFFTLTEPFLLLERIENLIRLILNEKFLVEDLKNLCQQGEKEPQYIDDLTFGQYIRLIEKPENWEKLNLKVDRSYVIKKLDEVREIRNDVMHFDTDGITEKQRENLVNMADFLTKLVKHKY
ncbi:XRE family transcriptional regulator [Capnocytophaga canis]|uniref:XRE family transcriptional regulator n=1 Tax=Capnocytophaga canis TaxID=1848903 RepID=A0A3A1YIZ0_9FLAO|nr:CBS domain-containing protein [Capnocytophaga canis]RIY37010.1 XRE family transcriptional regulator [Capnocytophaga canis]